MSSMTRGVCPPRRTRRRPVTANRPADDDRRIAGTIGAKHVRQLRGHVYLPARHEADADCADMLVDRRAADLFRHLVPEPDDLHPGVAKRLRNRLYCIRGCG
jgi:hypothetical protein